MPVVRSSIDGTPCPEPVERTCPELVEGTCPEPVEGTCPEPVEGTCPEPVEGRPPAEGCCARPGTAAAVTRHKTTATVLEEARNIVGGFYRGRTRRGFHRRGRLGRRAQG